MVQCGVNKAPNFLRYSIFICRRKRIPMFIQITKTDWKNAIERQSHKLQIAGHFTAYRWKLEMKISQPAESNLCSVHKQIIIVIIIIDFTVVPTKDEEKEIKTLRRGKLPVWWSFFFFFCFFHLHFHILKDINRISHLLFV